MSLIPVGRKGRDYFLFPKPQDAGKVNVHIVYRSKDLFFPVRAIANPPQATLTLQITNHRGNVLMEHQLKGAHFDAEGRLTWKAEGKTPVRGGIERGVFEVNNKFGSRLELEGTLNLGKDGRFVDPMVSITLDFGGRVAKLHPIAVLTCTPSGKDRKDLICVETGRQRPYR